MLYDYLTFYVAERRPERCEPALFVHPAEFEGLIIACGAEVIRKDGHEYIARRPRLRVAFHKLPVIRDIRYRRTGTPH